MGEAVKTWVLTGHGPGVTPSSLTDYNCLKHGTGHDLSLLPIRQESWEHQLGCFLLVRCQCVQEGALLSQKCYLKCRDLGLQTGEFLEECPFSVARSQHMDCHPLVGYKIKLVGCK